jgi:hypothetical protein
MIASLGIDCSECPGERLQDIGKMADFLRRHIAKRSTSE